MKLAVFLDAVWAPLGYLYSIGQFLKFEANNEMGRLFLGRLGTPWV